MNVAAIKIAASTAAAKAYSDSEFNCSGGYAQHNTLLTQAASDSKDTAISSAIPCRVPHFRRGISSNGLFLDCDGPILCGSLFCPVSGCLCLAACPAGSHAHLVVRDQTDQFGYRGNLPTQSFELLDPRIQIPQTLTFDEIGRVGCENRVSGVGFSHRHSSAGFLIILGVAVGVRAGIIAAERN
ncbi:MAG: hypothetical protein P4K83_05595 [Terracidiphilus sp.]|nr:hypothetical protein [Terracidiphilus sp.]